MLSSELLGTCRKYRAGLLELYAGLPEEEAERREEAGEAHDLISYLADILDVEYIVSSSKDFVSARVYLALASPTIYIDTEDAVIKGFYGSDRVEVALPFDLVDEINDIFSTIWEDMR